MIWQYSLTPFPSTVSPPLGYLMCLARFGMRHTQINILPRGATVESPRWASKKNILSFIYTARSSHSCLDVVVYPGTGPFYLSLGSDFSVFRKEWDWIFLTTFYIYNNSFTQTVKRVVCNISKRHWNTAPHTLWCYENQRQSVYNPVVVQLSWSLIHPILFISCLSFQIPLFSLVLYTYAAQQPHFLFFPLLHQRLHHVWPL